MDIKQLSTTFVSNWQLCPKKAWRSYVRRNELGNDNEGSDATRFGTVVHAVMEEAHNDLLSLNLSDTADMEAYALDLFDRFWQQNTCYDFDRYELGRDKIGAFLARSIFNRPGRTVSAELLFVMDITTNRIWVDPYREKISGIVDEIREAGGVPVISTIDRVDRIDNEDGTYGIEIHDYKTNLLPFTRYEIESSIQLGIYAKAAKLLYPEAASIVCVYDMVRHGRFPVEFPDGVLDIMMGFLTNMYTQVKNTKEPEERINKYCRWCEIRSDCGSYKEQLDSPRSEILTDDTDIAQAFDEYERLQNTSKIVEQRIEELKQMFMAKIVKETNGEPIAITDDKEIYLQTNSRSSYSIAGVWDTLSDSKALILLKDVASISKQSMDRVLRTRPELKAKMEPHLSKSYNKPSLKARSRKAGKLKGEEPDDNE